MALKVLGKKGKTPDNVLVGVAGFEPATPASRTHFSTWLSHTPTRTRLISFGLAHRKKPDEGREIPVDVSLNTQILPANDAAVASAAQCLKQGGLVAFPTETVYGLGADATKAGAIARLYEAKGRPLFNPLIATVGDIAAAITIARFDATATRL